MHVFILFKVLAEKEFNRLKMDKEIRENESATKIQAFYKMQLQRND